MGRGGLRVVVPAHVAVLPHQLDAVRQAAEVPERGTDAVRGRTARQCRGRGRQRVRPVERQRAPELGDVDELHGRTARRDRAHQRGALLVELHRPTVDLGVEPDADELGAGHVLRRGERLPCDRRCVDHRVVGGDDGGVARALVPPHAGLGQPVVVERAVHVEVVGGEVEPRAHPRREPAAVREPERGRLHDEHVQVVAGDGLDERDLQVADRCGAHAGAVEHGGDEGGDRGLAVGPRDGQHRAVVPGPRQVELAQHRAVVDAGEAEQRVLLGQARRRHDGVGFRDQRVQLVGAGLQHQPHAELVGECHRGVGTAVVGQHHVEVVRDRGPGDRDVGDAHAVQQQPPHAQVVAALGHARPPARMNSR